MATRQAQQGEWRKLPLRVSSGHSEAHRSPALGVWCGLPLETPCLHELNNPHVGQQVPLALQPVPVLGLHPKPAAVTWLQTLPPEERLVLPEETEVEEKRLLSGRAPL